MDARRAKKRMSQTESSTDMLTPDPKVLRRPFGSGADLVLHGTWSATPFASGPKPPRRLAGSRGRKRRVPYHPHAAWPERLSEVLEELAPLGEWSTAQPTVRTVLLPSDAEGPLLAPWLRSELERLGRGRRQRRTAMTGARRDTACAPGASPAWPWTPSPPSTSWPPSPWASPARAGAAATCATGAWSPSRRWSF